MEQSDIEKSPQDLLKELRTFNTGIFGYDKLIYTIKSLCVEEIIDLLELLKPELIPGDEKFDHKLFGRLYFRLSLSFPELLKIYFSNIFPGEKIEQIDSSPRTDDNCFIVYTDKFHKTSSFKDISIPKLRQINNQLKLGGGVTEEVASSVTKFNEAQLKLLEMQKQFESIDESTLKNPLVMQQIINNEKIIKELLAGLSEKKEFFNSDLGPLAEKMGWHLHYSGGQYTIGSLQIRDKENKLVDIGEEYNMFQTFKCVYSSDPETIALSGMSGETLKFVDIEKKGQEITWQQSDIENAKEGYYDYIDPEMYDLANTILKKGFSGKISVFQDEYFMLSTKAGCTFFDNKGNELSDEGGFIGFDEDYNYEIVDGKVITKELKKVDKTIEDRLLRLFRKHRDKPTERN